MFVRLLCGLLLLSSCAYIPGVKQGNYLEQKQVDALEVGMSQEEVEFLIGPPSIVDPNNRNRVFYFYTVGDDAAREAAFGDTTAVVLPQFMLNLDYQSGRLINKTLTKQNQ